MADLIIGDVVHNLRSALNHLAFALSEAERGPAPNPPPKPDRRKDIGFPI